MHLNLLLHCATYWNFFHRKKARHTRFVKWVHSPRDGRRHQDEVGHVVGHNPHLVHFDSIADLFGFLPSAANPITQTKNNIILTQTTYDQYCNDVHTSYTALCSLQDFHFHFLILTFTFLRIIQRPLILNKEKQQKIVLRSVYEIHHS